MTMQESHLMLVSSTGDNLSADEWVARYKRELKSLERGGRVDERTIVAYAFMNPQSAIRNMIDACEPDDNSLLSACARLFRERREEQTS
jgi:hypothetical protein